MATLVLSLPRECRRRGLHQEEDDTFDLPLDEVAPQCPEADIIEDDDNAMHTTSTVDIIMHAEVVLPKGRICGWQRSYEKVYILMGR